MTLTLTTEAANNVQSVIAAVADLLKIAYPSTFDVHQTLTNPPSNVHYSSSIDPNCLCSNSINSTTTNHLLSASNVPQSPNISRGSSTYKVGRETSVSIQSLIEMQPKYCRTCSQRLTAENLLKKRLNELPASIRELVPYSEPFVYFCNEQCFTSCLSSTQTPTTPQSTTTTTALTVNTAISNVTHVKNEPIETTSPPCTPTDTNDSPNGRQRRSSVKRRPESLSKVRDFLSSFL